MEFADENEGDIVENNNVVQADCAATPEALSNKGLKNKPGKRKQRKVLAQRKRLLLVK